MIPYFTTKIRHLKPVILILSLSIGLFIVYPAITAQENIDTSAHSKSLVLLYADLDNQLGLTNQSTQEEVHGADHDQLITLRTEIQDQISANPDLTVKLMVAQEQNNQVYTMRADTESQVEDWSEVGNPSEILTAWLTESVQGHADSASVQFALVDYNSDWLQSVRPVSDPLGNPCIANPAQWEDDGRPASDSSSQGSGHTDLEQALCGVQSETGQKIGLLRLDTVLDFLADRAEVGICSSLDSLLPPIFVRPQYINVSFASDGTVAEIPFQAEDILRYDMTNNLWGMLFDASDVGIDKGNLDAFHVMADGSLLLSVSQPLSLPSVGSVDDSDIVRFYPIQLGSETVGLFELYFDGSDVELTGSSEGIDAISMLPDGNLLISTVGNVTVNRVDQGQDEDVLLFEPTSLGEKTKGEWSLYLDGSTTGLDTLDENIVGIDYDPSLPEREALHLATEGGFVAPMVQGANPDILSYAPDGAKECTFELSQRWDDFKSDLAGEKLDGISYEIGDSSGLVITSDSDQTDLDDTSEGYQLYLPIVSRE